MSRVVEHLAEITGLRDRDQLDATLVGAIKDLLRPVALSVAVMRPVGEAAGQRWFTRARLGLGDLAATADPPWSDPETLAPLAAHPQRMACLLRNESLAEPGPPARAWFALASDAQAAGVLELECAAPLSDAQRRTVASVLRIFSNFQALLDYSERDTLTGLLNRKSFDGSFMRVAARCPTSEVRPDLTGGRRQGVGGDAWLGVIDIDHFKRVNDDYGHLIGDEVLLLLARLMRSTFRFDDRLYRFGGEEFVALIRCDGAADAAAAFERMRANVESFVFPQAGHITVSAGFTAVRGGDTPSSAFERADKAVYHAKQNGRNRVADHALLVRSGALTEDSRDSDVELF